LYSKDKGTNLDKHDEENSKEKIQSENKRRILGEKVPGKHMICT
jgi:hypothetical protein